MGRIDLIFLHIPKWINYYRPINHYIGINFLPMGLLAERTPRIVAFGAALQKVKCGYFCFIHPDARKSSAPFWGRRLCEASSLFWKTKEMGTERK
jgi:hypothetical protein